MEINKVIHKLLESKIIQSNIKNYKKLSGGTVSELFLISCSDGSNLVVKTNDPQIVKSEANFLDYYKEIGFFPKIQYVDESFQYIVYSYISGSTNYGRNNKKEILLTLVDEVINQYKPVLKPSGWGWADELFESWKGFLLNRAIEANETLTSHLDDADFYLILDLIKSPNRFSGAPYLIHGDCGVHNFIFNENHLCGVIDPTPVIGDPLYDLIYAFCSSPDDLSKDHIDSLISNLVIGERKNNHTTIYEEVLIGLYLRLGTCLKHHPNDFNEYMKSWNYWKNSILEK